MLLGASCQVVNDPGSIERTVWNGMPFDGVTPDAMSMWALVSNNGNP
jgi:hypothetical protein